MCNFTHRAISVKIGIVLSLKYVVIIMIIVYVVFDYLGLRYLDRRAKEMHRNKNMSTVSVGECSARTCVCISDDPLPDCLA